MDRARLIALLRERSVATGDFVLSSGRRSHWYIDCRRTTMHAEGLALIGALGLAAIRDAGWAPTAVGGLTLGADPVAYAIARASHDAPPAVHGFTVRKQAKTHGAGRRVEGCFEPGMPVVVVEDVITTGGSALEAAAAVREAGGQIAGVFAVVDREEGGSAAIAAAGYQVRTLLRGSELLGTS
ncbi:MAG: orotate phosphoribosyltransferase [Gemmatimonadetes bacterium GWC2_71_10]|nr:MAG: orotate phosphoribosyltransferase [Gemmatimonadetes bacterium GWC2_71_10]